MHTEIVCAAESVPEAQPFTLHVSEVTDIFRQITYPNPQHEASLEPPQDEGDDTETEYEFPVYERSVPTIDQLVALWGDAGAMYPAVVRVGWRLGGVMSRLASFCFSSKYVDILSLKCTLFRRNSFSVNLARYTMTNIITVEVSKTWR